MPSRPQRRDRLAVGALRMVAAVSGLIVLLVVFYLALEAWPALRSPGIHRFLADETWDPTHGPAAGSFDLWPMIAGTAATTLGAMLLAGPLGVLSAVFARFYAPAGLQRWYRRLIQLLAGIPSVVYGFWGLVTLAPLVRQIAPPGTSLVTGVLVLALMILPTVALLTDAALASVPRSYVEGAWALSLSRSSALFGVILPAAKSGISVALILGAMRAIGETMAVLMVCGNIPRVPRSLFDPVRTLTANIALELGYATAAHRSALFVSGALLMVMVIALVFSSERIKRGVARA